MKLSILVLTTPKRLSTFLPKIVTELCLQAEGKDVEVLWLGDNYKRTVGAKRNALIEICKGEYFCFVDDDDWVVSDYVTTILQGLQDKPTVFCFGAYRHHNGKKDREVRFGVEYKTDKNSTGAYFRIPNHLMVWNKKSVEGVRFEELNFGEDSKWAMEVLKLIKKQSRTRKILYQYYFNSSTTETQNFG